MDRAKQERKALRGQFTKCANKLEEALSTVPPSTITINAAFNTLSEKRQKLVEVDNRIFSLWLDVKDRDDTAFEEDLDTTEEYSLTWFSMESKYKEATAKIEREGSDSNYKTSDNFTRLLKLPKLELPKFDGDIKKWINFWGMFSKIHDDENMDEDVKFQYLSQSMEPGSSAQELVDSYPPTAANYEKAIQQLKDRFGRDELLIEIYVRELLTLVLEQNKNSSSTSISKLYDKLKSQLNALDSLGVTSDRYAAMLRPLVESALPVELLRVWERRSKEHKDKSNLLANLLEFIKLEVESEERIKISRPSISSASYEPSASCLTAGVKQSSNMTSVEKRNCLFCDKPTQHASSECTKAMKLSLEERKDVLRKVSACYACLAPGHRANRCRSQPMCLICGRKHVTLMCENTDKDKPSVSGAASKSSENENTDSTQTLLNQSSLTTTVILPTLMLRVVHKEKSYVVRALLDSGAQKSFIKASLAKQLNLKPCGETQISHNLFGGVVTKKEIHKSYAVTLKTIDDSYETKMEFIEQDTICKDLPKVDRDILSALKEKGVQVSDCSADVIEISLLIGADFLGAIMTGRMITVKDSLIAIQTHFGWSLQGPTLRSSSDINVLHTTTFDVEDLWRLETVGIKDDAKTHKITESEINTFFENTIRINEEGRYEVKLPFKELTSLPTNYDLALKRLKSNTNRLTTLGIIKDYDLQFQEWKQSDIIETVDDADSSTGHYLPHHVVIKEASLTTKIRPVFDASACQTRSGFSLNDCLEKGQNMIELIPPLFIRFRKGAIGVVSDIKKAFLQISLYPEDRDYLKFLWWRDIEANPKELVTYRHRRVVFGVVTSPYLLMATIYHHLNKYNSETANIMKGSFYCDNCVTSLDNAAHLEKFEREAKDIMLQGKFELRCWVSSGPLFLDETVTETSVLGLKWNPRSDELYCKVPDVTVKEITKRTLLSLAQSIFDPIGFISPYTLIPKLLLQKCWKLEIDWDTKLPNELQKEAKDWLENIEVLNDCRIPRCISHADLKLCQCTLHTFSDASALAFSACVFLRSEYDGVVSIQLLLAKSRVTPAKEITMPRLELTAAVLASRLACETKRALDLPLCGEYYWTDSAIVLAWIQRGFNLNVYVHNRIKEIKENSKGDDWRHLPGTMNPADLPSRGCNARALLKSRWWEGPDWLKGPTSDWPCVEIQADIREVNKEVKTTSLIVQTGTSFLEKLCYFSKFSKTVRTIAWCIRFIRNCRNKVNKEPMIGEEITGDAYEEAEKSLFAIIQREEFTNIQSLKKSLNMEIYEDKDKLLRVKTRLTLPEEQEDFMTPILLPGSNFLTESLVRQCHERLCHAGSLTLISKLRENVWIIGVRLLTKKIIRKCVICRRYSAKKCATPPAPLPIDRTKCGTPFDVTGIDYAGPIQLRNREKCWIALFTCASYRAVHLELCRALSTEEFLLALRRFIARRGRPTTIYSDNGTNFRGAERLLRAIDWTKIETETSIMKIKWHFSPPSAPWWGGFWERLVKSVKEILRRILGKASLDAVSLETVLCEVESVINTRPLAGSTGGTEEVAALTPAMFLLPGCRTQGTPDLDAIDLSSSARRLQELRDQLRRRFRSEYLSLLTQKAAGKIHEVKPGDLVIIETPNVKRVLWPLAKVMEVYTGPDNHARVAKLRTSRGELVRPIQRLFALEISSSTAAPGAGGC